MKTQALIKKRYEKLLKEPREIRKHKRNEVDGNQLIPCYCFCVAISRNAGERGQFAVDYPPTEADWWRTSRACNGPIP